MSKQNLNVSYCFLPKFFLYCQQCDSLRSLSILNHITIKSLFLSCFTFHIFSLRHTILCKHCYPSEHCSFGLVTVFPHQQKHSLKAYLLPKCVTWPEVKILSLGLQLQYLLHSTSLSEVWIWMPFGCRFDSYTHGEHHVQAYMMYGVTIYVYDV